MTPTNISFGNNKIIVGKFPLGGPSTIFNLRKIDLDLVFCYIRPYNFFTKIAYNSFVIHQKQKQEKSMGLYYYYCQTGFEIK